MTRARRNGMTSASPRGSMPRLRRLRGVRYAGFAVAVGVAAATCAADVPSLTGAPPDGVTALALCQAASTAPATERATMLDCAYVLADAAATANTRDPVAHFAVFCALGRRLQGVGLSFGALRAVRRMRIEIDTALALEPDYVDALIGKGAMLAEAPRMVGGDLQESERLLRRAIELAPANPDAFVYLGRTLLAAGRRTEARAAAERALALAEQQGNPVVAAAQRLVTDAR